MNKYEIRIYWSDADNLFIAEVPELAGCMADGSTYNEALINIELVMKQWKETALLLKREIPEPKGKLILA